ncbi:unnamed protein product [Prorocentrum cordatum]|uniref:Uncharacterized protein n=1 Tax=Prorocentrum cordatum TaxID=2364126 RepID=A0ABN9TIY3_9DINO|nr:unnamed protein product [Polarella glacialis]
MAESTFHARRLIGTLRERIGFVNAQAHAGLDRNLLAQAQANALNATFAATPGVDLAVATVVTQEISNVPWTQQQKISMATALNQRAQAASGVARAGGSVGRPRQKCQNLQRFFTTADWGAIASEDNSEVMKLQVVARRMRQIGITCAGEKLLMRAVAVGISCHQSFKQTPPQATAKRNTRVDLQSRPRQLDTVKTWPFARIEVHPPSPDLFGRDRVLNCAHGDERTVAPPAELDNLEAEVQGMVHRRSSRQLGGGASSAAQSQQSSAAFAVPGRLQHDPPQLLMSPAARACGPMFGAPSAPPMFGAGADRGGGCNITCFPRPQGAASPPPSSMAFGSAGAGAGGGSPPTDPPFDLVGGSGACDDSDAWGESRASDEVEDFEQQIVAAAPVSHAIDYSDWLKPADAKTRSENAFTSRAHDAAKRMAVAAGKGDVDSRAIAKEAHHKAKLVHQKHAKK